MNGRVIHRRLVRNLPRRIDRIAIGSVPAVFVMAAPPRLGKFEAVLVSAPRGEVEELVGPHQRFGATGIGGVGVVDSAVLQREDAHALLLRLGLVDMLIVVVGAVSLLFLGEGGSEVVPESLPSDETHGNRQPICRL